VRSFDAIDAEIDSLADHADAQFAAVRLLAIGEEVLERWIVARRGSPAAGEREGFRLLDLHHQGAKGVPSFNACRETCREIAYHYNLICLQPADASSARNQRMMALLARHLALFVGGKMEVEGLGDFCCASRPLHAES
jgi:hypothetical protein